LERSEHVAEWVRLTEEKMGQVAPLTSEHAKRGAGLDDNPFALLGVPYPPTRETTTARPNNYGRWARGIGMTRLAAAVLLGFIILSATIAFLGRYEVSAEPGGAALVTDRWRGTVQLCATPMDNVTVICFPRFPQHWRQALR
jgi:hypothetical protein